MKRPVRRGNMRRQLAPLWRKIGTALALAVAFAMPRPTHAAKTQSVPSFSERAAKVKQAIDQMTPAMEDSHQTPHLMQWGNWGNWNNWPNWGNWNNWFNWLKY